MTASYGEPRIASGSTPVVIAGAGWTWTETLALILAFALSVSTKGIGKSPSFVGVPCSRPFASSVSPGGAVTGGVGGAGGAGGATEVAPAFSGVLVTGGCGCSSAKRYSPAPPSACR